MTSFDDYMEQVGEVGVVDQVSRSIVYVRGLPEARPSEVVMSRGGSLGQVLSLKRDVVEVLMLSTLPVRVGEEVVRTDAILELPVGDEYLGTMIDPLGGQVFGDTRQATPTERRNLESAPPGIDRRKDIDTAFETGVVVVDLVVPMGVGQRELVIGDRKIGKTSLLKQAMVSHAKRGGITVYGAIAKRQSEIRQLQDFVVKSQISDKVVMIVSSSADMSGMIFQTPYAAMTMAEFFRDQGRDVLVILDDLTIHAKYYREITLLAKRFPGRSSYPGDIFYVHARLLERAGNFQTGSITALPVAETDLGDISGFIQTNLMSMTDGHIFFDQELFNQGRRPAVNPFLSVTRVGHQAQTLLYKDLSRILSSFLVKHERFKEFLHFGGELSDTVKATLALGGRVMTLMDQAEQRIVPMNVAAVMLAGLWAPYWEKDDTRRFKTRVDDFLTRYESDEKVKHYFDGVIAAASTFEELINLVKQQPQFFQAM